MSREECVAAAAQARKTRDGAERRARMWTAAACPGTHELMPSADHPAPWCRQCGREVDGTHVPVGVAIGNWWDACRRLVSVPRLPTNQSDFTLAADR